MQNVINLVLDLKNKNYNYIVIQQNDDVVIEAELYDNGIPVNLSNHTVIANFTAANDAFINIAGSKITKNNNKTTIVCEKYFSQSVGNATGQITLVDATSKQASTFPFKIKVNKGVIQNSASCSNASSILEQLTTASVTAIYRAKTLNTAVNTAKENIQQIQETYPEGSALAEKVEGNYSDITKLKGRFVGKKYVAVGDSITVGFVDKPYATLVGEHLGLTVVNQGVAGSRYTKAEDKTDSVVERLENIPSDADIISVFAGTNDFGHGMLMGKGSDLNSVENFYGAVNHVANYLLTNFPNAQIFFITPLHRGTEDTENRYSYVLEDYVNVIRDVANHYSIPVLDFFADSSFNIKVQGSVYSADGLHPIQVGHNIMGYKIAQFIQKRL